LKRTHCWLNEIVTNLVFWYNIFMQKNKEEILNFGGKEIKYILRDEADRSVLAEIFRYREYRIADQVIKSAKNAILDVGAHCGFFTIYCRMLNEKTKIFSVEPEEKNFSALNHHIAINNLKNIKVSQFAICGKTGKCNLSISKDSHDHKINYHDDGEQINCVTLRDFCVKEHIKKISLLKMDIEGAEFEVVESLWPENFEMVENIIMEYHNYNGLNYKNIEKKLRENGFGVQVFKSKFDRYLGFIFANNKRI
jgi:FkbM family methyltransferase